LMTTDDGFVPDFEDEIVAGSAVTHQGRIRHEPTREAIEGPAPEPEPTPEPAAEPAATDAPVQPYDQETDQ
jgi:H+-translocating NAD(P) transhydrogenase subunit alpha